MKDDLTAAGGLGDPIRVEDVALEELYTVEDVGEILPAAGGEIVDDADPIASPDERARDRRAYETGPASDQGDARHGPL